MAKKKASGRRHLKHRRPPSPPPFTRFKIQNDGPQPITFASYTTYNARLDELYTYPFPVPIPAGRSAEHTQTGDPFVFAVDCSIILGSDSSSAKHAFSRQDANGDSVEIGEIEFTVLGKTATLGRYRGRALYTLEDGLQSSEGPFFFPP